MGANVLGRFGPTCPVRTTNAAASIPQDGHDVDDEPSGWSIKNVIATILDFLRTKPDPTPEPP